MYDNENIYSDGPVTDTEEEKWQMTITKISNGYIVETNGVDMEDKFVIEIEDEITDGIRLLHDIKGYFAMRETFKNDNRYINITEVKEEL